MHSLNYFTRDRERMNEGETERKRGGEREDGGRKRERGGGGRLKERQE